MEMYLLTFCPPAPDDLEKVVLAMEAGIVPSLRFENHWRAVARSASPTSVDREEYDRNCCMRANWPERGLIESDLRV
jgi:hypothetical protein